MLHASLLPSEPESPSNKAVTFIFSENQAITFLRLVSSIE